MSGSSPSSRVSALLSHLQYTTTSHTPISHSPCSSFIHPPLNSSSPPTPSTSTIYDVIVVGLGSMGSSTLYYIAKSGLSVLGIEKFDVSNSMGSHVGDTRIIRFAYFEHPSYVPLVRRSYDLWQQLERDACPGGGVKVLHVTGGLDIGPRGSEGVEGAKRSCILNDIPYEELSPGQVKNRFPAFNSIPDNYYAIYQKDAAILEPEKCVALYTKLARERYGAHVIAGDGVDSIEYDQYHNGDIITLVHTEGGHTYRARQVVLCNGAFLPKLLRKSFVDHERTPLPSHKPTVDQVRQHGITKELVPSPSLVSSYFPGYEMNKQQQQSSSSSSASSLHLPLKPLPPSASCHAPSPNTSPSSLIPLIAHSIHPERNVVVWYTPLSSSSSSSGPDPSWYVAPKMPIWLLDDEGQSFFYGFPQFGQQKGVKMGLYRHSREIYTDHQLDHAAARTPCTEEDAKLCVSFTSRIFGDQFRPSHVETAKSCIFTNSPDGHFIIDQFLGNRLIIMSCCSGHGFKFSSAIGEGVMEMITKGTSERFNYGWLSGRRLGVYDGLGEGEGTGGVLFKPQQTYVAKKH